MSAEFANRIFSRLSPEIRGGAKSISCAVVRLRCMAHCWRMKVRVESAPSPGDHMPRGRASTRHRPYYGRVEPNVGVYLTIGAFVLKMRQLYVNVTMLMPYHQLL